MALDMLSYDLVQLIRVVIVAAATYVAMVVGARIIRGVFRSSPLPKNVESGIVRAFRIIVFLAGFSAAVSQLGIDLTGIAVGLGAASIAVSLAMSTVIGNLVAGVLVMGDRAFVAGDEITVMGQTGRVMRIGLRTTVIEQEGGNIVFIPNSVFVTNPVVKKAPKDSHIGIANP